MKARHEFESEQAYQDYLRTYFAAMALQGILANSTFTDNAKSVAREKGIPLTDDALELIYPFCKLATDFADALINALNQKK